MTTESAVTVISDFEPKTIAIGDYDPKRFNMLVRGKTVLQTNPFLRPVVREISLDQPGDTYPITQRKDGDEWVATEVGISAVGLFVLSDNSGIVDVPQASGRVDDGRDPGICTYRATIAMRMPDGEWSFRTRECTVKLATLEKEIRTQKTAKASQWKWTAQKLEAEIAKELLLKEKFLERLAETGAKTRAIRAILGIRTKYTPEEIRRPFVFVAVVQDMSQPELRARMLDQATSAIGAVFGPAGAQSGAAPRLLGSGPAADEITEADARPGSDEPTGELGSDEIAGTAVTVRTDVDPDGPAGETPDWITAGTADRTASAEKPAIDLADVLRSHAESSTLKGKATEPQLKKLRATVFDGIEGTIVGAGIVRVFGDAALKQLTAAQANAFITAHDSNDHEAFAAAWTAMVQDASGAA